MDFYIVWSLLIFGSEVMGKDIANKTQHQDLNMTVENRRNNGYFMPPRGRGGPGESVMPPGGPGPGDIPPGGPGDMPSGGPGDMPPGPGPPGPAPPGNNGESGNDPRSGAGHVNDVVKAAAGRFTVPPSSTRRFQRTTPRRVSFKEDCDYLAHYCLKAYNTGVLCGRSLYYQYFTFKNYCLLDYVNCMERYEVWQVVHMGECFKVKELTEYVEYPYEDDFFLDQYYIVEDL